jgi:uncharacterized alkaline shock family protein YloU
MKKNIVLRILAVLSGLVLAAAAVLVVAEAIFHAPVTECARKLMFAHTPMSVLIALLVSAALLGLGVSCILLAFARKTRKQKGFVMQKNENGVIGVSVKSIEGLVKTCVDQHEMIAKADISVAERRDGIVIFLGIEEAAGLNIPLAVGALQKQIKEYVGTCTGVDVREVRVLVENTDTDAAGSPYVVERPSLIPGMPAEAEPAAEAPVEESVMEASPVEEPAEVMPEVPVLEEVAEEAVEPVATPVPIMPVMPEMIEEEDDRPLHQRIFGAEEQPVFVPAPPELVIEPQTEEIPEEAAVETVEEAIPEEPAEEAAEEIDANAVLEVVEAIAQEEELAEDEFAVEETAEYDEEVLAEEAMLDGEDEEVRE